MTDETGNRDQRFCTRDEHDKARSWFEKTYQGKQPEKLKGEALRAQKQANMDWLWKKLEERGLA